MGVGVLSNSSYWDHTLTVTCTARLVPNRCMLHVLVCLSVIRLRAYMNVDRNEDDDVDGNGR